MRVLGGLLAASGLDRPALRRRLRLRYATLKLVALAERLDHHAWRGDVAGPVEEHDAPGGLRHVHVTFLEGDRRQADSRPALVQRDRAIGEQAVVNFGLRSLVFLVQPLEVELKGGRALEVLVADLREEPRPPPHVRKPGLAVVDVFLALVEARR